MSYNAQVMRERRSRLPYVDAQTGIAQADSYNWKKRSDRNKGILPGDPLWCAFIGDMNIPDVFVYNRGITVVQVSGCVCYTYIHVVEAYIGLCIVHECQCVCCVCRSDLLLFTKEVEAGTERGGAGGPGQGDQGGRREASGDVPLIVGANSDPGGRSPHQEELTYCQQEGQRRWSVLAIECAPVIIAYMLCMYKQTC